MQSLRLSLQAPFRVGFRLYHRIHRLLLAVVKITWSEHIPQGPIGLFTTSGLNTQQGVEQKKATKRHHATQKCREQH